MPMFKERLLAKFFDENGDRVALDFLVLPKQAILRPMKGDIISSKSGKKYEIISCEIVATDERECIQYTLKDLTLGNKAPNL